MEASITMKDQEMVEVFTAALQDRGYSPAVNDLVVSFTFDQPKSGFQPTVLLPDETKLAQEANQKLAQLYAAQGFPNNDPNNIPDDSPVVQEIANFFALIGSLEGLESALEDIGIDVAEILKYLT